MTLQEAESLEAGDRVILDVDLKGGKIDPRTGTIGRFFGSQYVVIEFPTVISVGGTYLSVNHSKYSEAVWAKTGGGCSAEAKPSWQHDPSCVQRTGNDVAAVAASVAVYDTYDSQGWAIGDGTSVSSPLVAGVYGLAGNADKQHFAKGLWTLSKGELKEDLHVIRNGNNGCPRKLAGSYLCTAGTGQYGTYAGPTGWGTPNGIGAF